MNEAAINRTIDYICGGLNPSDASYMRMAVWSLYDRNTMMPKTWSIMVLTGLKTFADLPGVRPSLRKNKVLPSRFAEEMASLILANLDLLQGEGWQKRMARCLAKFAKNETYLLVMMD